MGRAALAAGGLGVAALVGVLLIQSRPEDADGGDPAERAARPTESAPEPALAPRRMSSPSTGDGEAAAAGDEESALPTAEEVAEARKRVAAERTRPAHLSPDLVMDHKLKARPMRDARKAYKRGEYDVALARAEDALAVEPESNAARVLATLAACALGERAVARAHAGKLDEMRQGRVASKCEALGVDLDLTP
jgi:hypothetical protein